MKTSDKYYLSDFCFSHITVTDAKDLFRSDVIPNTTVDHVVINERKR